MSYNTKTYKEQGGNAVHFGGRVVFEEGSHLEGLPAAKNLPNTASVSDLILALKEAGLMEPDTWNIIVNLVPSPTDEVVTENHTKVESTTLKDDTLTIVVDPEKLTESASSVPEQGTHKWLGLEIRTGISDITKVQFCGKNLTQADADEATLAGCPAGSFVLYVKADELVEKSVLITLKTDGYALKTIRLRVEKPTEGS